MLTTFMIMCCSCFIESENLLFYLLVWVTYFEKEEQVTVKGIIRMCCQIAGTNLNDQLYKVQITKKAQSTSADQQTLVQRV